MDYGSFNFVSNELRKHIDISQIVLMTKIYNGDNIPKLSVIWTNDKNECYCYGYNINGCLALNISKINVNKPMKIGKVFENQRLIKLSSGLQFVLALNEHGQCYSWGNNKFGQLGQNKKLSYNYKPQLIDLQEPIADIACGLNHSIVLTKSEKIYSFGANLTGAVGNGTLIHQIKPALVLTSSFDFVQIACGGWHSAAINLKG